MNLQDRILLLVKLGVYIQENGDAWQQAKVKAQRQNGWFVPAFIDLAANNISQCFLQKDALTKWTAGYQFPSENQSPKNIGLVMAGNIPMVGFHDLLCCFISGNKTIIKQSTKDDVLIKHLVEKLYEWDPEVKNFISFADQLRHLDAYIATGSNNTSRYFEFYFGKYPSIIRKNRTSVAILDGTETAEELNNLADDVMLYFGLGCRNVTKLFVPTGYDFVPLLEAINKYKWAADHNKYKNNYDYNLALLMLNSKYYMCNENILLVENEQPFSPISQLNYEFYDDVETVLKGLKNNENIQTIIGHFGIPFGQTQSPSLTDYADGVDTMEWLGKLGK